MLIPKIRILMRPTIITGGIGSGKSSVCELLAKKGVEIIDADKIAHELLDKNSEKVANIFGKEYVLNGKVDRKSLGKKIFNDKASKDKLEELLHPLVHQEITKRWNSCKRVKKLCVIDIPLFFESKNRYESFFIVVVSTTLALQKERIKKRDGLFEDEIDARINSQIPLDFKIKNCDYVIENIKDLNHLKHEVDKLYRWIKEY